MGPADTLWMSQLRKASSAPSQIPFAFNQLLRPLEHSVQDRMLFSYEKLSRARLVKKEKLNLFDARPMYTPTVEG